MTVSLNFGDLNEKHPLLLKMKFLIALVLCWNHCSSHGQPVLKARSVRFTVFKLLDTEL